MEMLRNDVERWLIHENHKFKNNPREDANFCILVKNLGSFQIPIEIFEPKKQPGVLVIGGKVYFQNRQTARYLKLTDSEREKFHNSIKDYCDSIFAIHKIFKEEGKVIIGVYVVLDKIERFTQQMVLDALAKTTDLSEKTAQFILKTF